MIHRSKCVIILPLACTHPITVHEKCCVAASAAAGLLQGAWWLSATESVGSTSRLGKYLRDGVEKSRGTYDVVYILCSR